jgi:hypothetical protein
MTQERFEHVHQEAGNHPSTSSIALALVIRNNAIDMFKLPPFAGD